MIRALLKKYGQSMEICDAQGGTLRTVKGFVQPLAFSDTDALWCLTPGGGVRQEKYLLIAPADAFNGDGAERAVVFQGRRYTVLRADNGEYKEQKLTVTLGTKDVLKGLKSAAGYLRRELGRALQLRYTPELQFIADDSIQQGAHILEVLRDPTKVKPENPDNTAVLGEED